jgi:hypothetical protein
MVRRNAGRAQRLLGRAPGDLLKSAPTTINGCSSRARAAGSVSHDRIQVREQRAVARAHVANVARLPGWPIENLDDDSSSFLK